MNYKFFIIILISTIYFSCSSIIKTVIPLSSLPEPSGAYNVGTCQFHLTDDSRLEWFSEKDTTDYRELMVQMWYPSDENPSIPPNPYMDNLEQRIPAVAEQINLPKFLIKQIKEIKTQSYQNLKISQKENSFPVLIFSHGLGGMRVQNTSYIQELISHGFVVIAMDHTYDANITIFPNNEIKNYKSNLPKSIKTENEALKLRYKQLKTRTDDITFVLNEFEKLNKNSNSQFYKKLSLDNVGIFGHSFGGATSISALFNEPRIIAGISLDGWFEILPPKILSKGLIKPFFHLGQEKWEKNLNYKNRDLLIKNSSGDNWVSTFLKSKHFDYMDLPLFTDKTRNFKLTGKIEPIEFYNCLNEIQLNFFNHYIKKNKNFNLNLIVEKYPFMIIEKSN